MYSETVLSEQRTLWRSVGSSAVIIPADGCVDLIVRSEQVLLCGPQTRVIHAPADDVDPTVGVRLEAGTARRVLPVALSELRNRVVELRTALGSEAVALYDLMMRASNASRPDLVLSELLVDQAEPWVTTAHRLARTGAPAREAARALDWSERTLRRRMLETFGYGYTTLARIERVFRARSLLQRGLSPAYVSATSGYADQPHLTREFAHLVGGDAGSVLQGREEVDAIAIGIEHRGVALPPGGVPWLGATFVSCSDEPGVGGIHSTHCPLVKGQGDAVTSRGRLITGIKTANEVDGVPCKNGAVFEPGIDMRLVAPYRNGRSKQTIEGE